MRGTRVSETRLSFQSYLRYCDHGRRPTAPSPASDSAAVVDLRSVGTSTALTRPPTPQASDGRSAQGNAAADHSHLARQAASALYHVVTLAGLRWEAARDTLEGRALLADLVLAHRLASRDPLVDNGAETDPRYLSLLKTAPEAP